MRRMPYPAPKPDRPPRRSAMLHRFLFVAGMTVGVMVPLVWAAYVSRPTAPAAHTPTVARTEAAPKRILRARPAGEDVTASIPPALAATPAPPMTAQIPPSPKPNARPPAIAPSSAEPMARPMRLRSQAVVAARRAEYRYLPAVVDTYNGAHIITVCAALTVNEQRRAGCP